MKLVEVVVHPGGSPITVDVAYTVVQQHDNVLWRIELMLDQVLPEREDVVVDARKRWDAVRVAL